MYLTGSRALDYWAGQENDSDIDVIASEKELRAIWLSFEGANSLRHGPVEFLNIDFLNNRAVCEAYRSHKTIELEGLKLTVLNATGLYIQKRSHLHRPLKFSRHILGLQKIKEIEPLHLPLKGHAAQLLSTRIKMTRAAFRDRTPSLAQTNEDFFDDAVTKYYIHDDLHEVMAFGSRPVYESLKRDKSLAMCERDLWDRLTYEQKIWCVCEEAFVIAVERFVIPKQETGGRIPPPKHSFLSALEKICTTLTSGYFRDFAIDNWAQVRDIGLEVDFYGKLSQAIQSGELKKNG